MIKKLLTLALVAVMLSTAALAAPGSTMLMNATYAAEEETVTEIACPLEMISVKKTTDGVSLANVSSTFETNANAWIYARCDISGLNTLEIKSAVLSIGMNFTTKATVKIQKLDSSVWEAAEKVIVGESVDTSIFVYPYSSDNEVLTSVQAEGGNTKNTTNTLYNFTDYDYVYYKDYWKSGAVDSWKKVTMKDDGKILETVKTVVGNEEEKYLYFSISSGNLSSTTKAVNIRENVSKLIVSSDVQVVHNSIFNSGKYAPIYEWPTDDFGSLTKDFTYNVVVAPEGTKVRMLCAIYDANDSLLDVVASDVLTAGEQTTSLSVPLSSYADAASVKCYLWDGTTLRPYTTPLETPAEIAATATE